MRYRNIKTGAEFESLSKISAPDWITVGAESPVKAAADPVIEDPEPAKRKATKRPAPKKKGAKK